MAELTPGQQSFLEMADRAGVSHDLFGQYKPDIQFQEAQPDATKSTIAYIHTGGTLAMVPSNDGGTISFEGAVNLPKIIEVCNYIAQVRRRYNIIGIHLANIDSKEIKPDAWTAMAATIKTVYDLIDGATLGHGTHTLEYSAAASSYALRNLAVPIVFAASQIPSVGFPGSDGIPNLTGAMEIAANGDFAEVLAYANGTIHRGSRVTKENDSRLNIFESKVTGPMGYFGAAGIEVGDGARRRMGKRKHELIFQPEFNSSIPSLKINPSIGPDLLRELLSGTEKAVGAVLETYGSAALPNDLVPVLQERLATGVPIYLTSSAGQSGVSNGMDQHDEDAVRAHRAGIRNAKDMTTPAAVTKLMSIMAQDHIPNDSAGKLAYVEQEMIGKSYAGEVTANVPREDF